MDTYVAHTSQNREFWYRYHFVCSIGCTNSTKIAKKKLLRVCDWLANGIDVQLRVSSLNLFKLDTTWSRADYMTHTKAQNQTNSRSLWKIRLTIKIIAVFFHELTPLACCFQGERCFVQHGGICGRIPLSQRKRLESRTALQSVVKMDQFVCREAKKYWFIAPIICILFLVLECFNIKG